MPKQVPLPFEFHGTKGFESFHPGPNIQVLDTLQALSRNQEQPFVFLWADKGLGKSHLLQAPCRARVLENACYLPLAETNRFGPELLQGIDGRGLVCIDDIEQIAGHSEWEEAVFHFFNRHRENRSPLLVSASVSPAKIGIKLPDLASRLKSGLALRLRNMNDQDKLEALTLKAKSMGLDLHEDVGRFLLRRYPRDLPTLWTILETLDYASLSEKRKLTIPFLKLQLRDR